MITKQANKINLKEASAQTGIIGKHKFSVCDVRHPKVEKLEQEILHTIRSVIPNDEKYNLLSQLYAEIRRLTSVRELVLSNIIPTVGRAVIAQRLASTNTYTLNVNYGAVGDDNTAVANGDTALGNEVYRKAISSYTSSNNIAYLSQFYASTDFNDTIEEFGWFIDGGAGADSGQLFSHFLTTTIAKSATETLTIESSLTIS